MVTVRNVLVIALWLQVFSGMTKAGERLKRELRFPKGGSFVAAVALASFLPKGPTDGLAHVLEFDLGFPFPDKFLIGKKTTGWHQRWKRSSKEEERRNLLGKIEDTITRIGFNGSACTARFQCELKNISPENSFLEEVLNVMFKTSFEPRECEVHDQACPVSLLQIIMHSEQISAPHMIPVLRYNRTHSPERPPIRVLNNPMQLDLHLNWSKPATVGRKITVIKSKK